MGIDIYARWPEQDAKALRAQIEAWASNDAGAIGYIREAYHGEPYPSQHLMPDAFENEAGAIISAATLRARLPTTLALAEERERTVYETTDLAEIAKAVKQYTDFVELCERIEKKKGTRPRIRAWW